MKTALSNRFYAVSALIYAVVVITAVAALGWLCFAHLPWWLALLMFPLGLMLGATVFAPLAAAGAYAGGAVVVGLTAIYRKFAASRRRGA